MPATYLTKPRTFDASIVSGDGVGFKTIAAAGNGGTKVQNLMASSTETATARDVAFYLRTSNPSGDFLLATLTIPVNSGFTNSVNPVAIFDHARFTALPIDTNGNRYMQLGSGDSLMAKMATVIAPSKAIQFVGFGGDF